MDYFIYFFCLSIFILLIFITVNYIMKRSQTATLQEVRVFIKGHIERTSDIEEIRNSHQMYRQVLYKINRLQASNEKLRKEVATLKKQIEQ